MLRTGKAKKKAVGIAMVLAAMPFAVLLGLLGISGHVKKTVSDQIMTPEQAKSLNVDCILVLGAGVWADGPSPMLRDRLAQGIALYENGASEKLLMSGDHGRADYDEVSVMKRVATEAGILSTDVFMDHAGFSTYESLYRARDVFKAKRIIIVSQEYHLYRALYISNALGIEAFGVSSDLQPYSGQSYREVREILARSKDYLKAVCKPLPRFLGDAVPIKGNGDITND